MHSKRLKSLVFETFKESNRPQPIIYGFTQDDFRKAEDWIIGPKTSDLITLCSYAQGFEHNLVVLFQYKDLQECNINSCMRSTGFLIIVKEPEEPLNKMCFSLCQNE